MWALMGPDATVRNGTFTTLRYCCAGPATAINTREAAKNADRILAHMADRRERIKSVCSLLVVRLTPPAPTAQKPLGHAAEAAWPNNGITLQRRGPVPLAALLRHALR